VLSSWVEVCKPGDAVRLAAIEAWAADDERWLRFIGTQPDATLFHHPAWSRVLTQTYGHRAQVLIQRGVEGEIVAGLPVVEMRGSLGGRRLRALPFTDHCPPLARSPANLARFTNHLGQWREAQGVERIAVHGLVSGVPDAHLAVRAVRHVLPLERSSSEVLEGLRGSPVHRAIRKAQHKGVEARISQSPDDLAPFYRLHLQTRQRLGVPVQPRRFIDTLWNEVIGADLGFVVIASYHARPIAAGLFLAWNGNLIYKFGASDPQYWALRPNNLVIWSAIDWACRHGYRRLDFGRTDLDNHGLRDFKNRWGSQEVPLVYSYIGRGPSDSLPRAPQRALTRLIRSSPPIVCRLIGEVLYRQLAAMAG